MNIYVFRGSKYTRRPDVESENAGCYKLMLQQYNAIFKQEYSFWKIVFRAIICILMYNRQDD